MDIVWQTLEKIDYGGIPIVKIALAIVILLLIQVLRRYLVAAIINSVEQFTSKNSIKFSDELISILKPSLNSLILILGLWLAKEILAENLGVQVERLLAKCISLIVLLVVASTVYKVSSIAGKIVAVLILHTGTELDDLLKPLLPKIFQSVAIVGITIKFSEIFLGQSAAALAGLLGGAGITLGLLYKDIVYDWFCTVIIYLDKVCKEGDWVKITGINSSVRVMHIGFRTTTLHIIDWGSIVKMPNSKMISGIVENWSQNSGKDLKFGINLLLKIDNISAQQTDRICDRIQDIPKSIPGCDELCRVRFSRIEANARTIEIRVMVNEESQYFIAERKLNLAILEILEDESVDFLAVQLQVDPDGYKQTQQLSNSN